MTKRMWLLPFIDLSYDAASRWHELADLVLVASLILGVAATYVSVKTAMVKEEYLKGELLAAQTRIAELNRKAEEDRLARVKIEERLAPRHLTDAQAFTLAHQLKSVGPAKADLFLYE